MEPIFANCTRWEALASTFAPQSIRRDTPFSVGINGASGGRSIPRILPTITCPPTRIAPELPADTNASASFCFTIFMPTTIDDCFFLRIAFTGGSAVSITSSACTTSICSFGYVYFSSSLFTTSCCPTNSTLISDLPFTASTAPFTSSAGALSPPIASTATFVISCCMLFSIP